MMNNRAGAVHKAGLIGNPVRHSVSPALQETAGRSCGIDLTYNLIQTDSAKLPETIRRLKSEGYAGFNVTIPHKERILDFIDESDRAVDIIGACNTVKIEDGRLKALNTDWEGFLDSWKEEGMGEIQGKTAVIIGAGGSAKALSHALCTEGAESIHLFSRTPERAEKICNSFSGLFSTIFHYYSINDVNTLYNLLLQEHILLNTTPVGMWPDVDFLPFPLPDRINPRSVCMDIVYNPLQTRLVRELRKCGIRAVGGIGMLVHQAKRSFSYWFQADPDTDMMRESALTKLQNSEEWI